MNAYLNPGLMGVIGAPTFPMLRDATQRTFFEILEIEEIRFTHRKVENAIVLTDNGSYIAFRSLDSVERLRGTNLAWFGVDELTYAKPDAWSRLEGRLRDTRAYRRCGFAAWTPKGFDESGNGSSTNPAPITPPYKLPRARIITSPRPAFTTRCSAATNAACTSRTSRGSIWRSTVAGSTTLSTFQQNVRPLTYNPLAPLCWSLDFNVDPMSSLIAQIEDRTTSQDVMMGHRTCALECSR